MYPKKYPTHAPSLITPLNKDQKYEKLVLQVNPQPRVCRFDLRAHKILHRCSRQVTKSCEIRKKIDWRLDSCKAGELIMMVEDTAHTFNNYLSTIQGDSLEQRATIYHNLVLWGKLRLVVSWITEREKVWVIHPEDTCPKKCKPVLDVLQ